MMFDDEIIDRLDDIYLIDIKDDSHHSKEIEKLIDKKQI